MKCVPPLILTDDLLLAVKDMARREHLTAGQVIFSLCATGTHGVRRSAAVYVYVYAYAYGEGQAVAGAWCVGQ